MFLLEGATRDGYNPYRDPISSLSIGRYGWIQALVFLIIGALMFLFAVGLRRTLKSSSINSFWGPLLIGLAGVGAIGAGIFTTDPFIGYPASILTLPPPTLHGQLHNFFSAFFFLGLPVATFVFTRYFLKVGKRSWAIYSLFSGIGALLFFVFTSLSIVASTGTAPTAGLLNAYTVGLMQRVTVIVIFLWVTLLAAYMLKAASATEKACKQQKGPSVPAGTASGPLQSGPSGFKFNPPGQLQTNTGQGDSDGTVYAPGMRFPIEKPNAYANSQVYRRGGGDQGGDQCKAANYSYPWSDNFCEIRDRTTPLCPAGKGHQGQDIRPNS